MNKKGFTLVELLVTVAIIGILAAIAIPMYIGYQKGAARQEATTNLNGLSLCLEEYFAENNRYLPSTDAPPQTYTWSVDNNGVDNSPAPTLASWLTCFNPRKASGGAVNKYAYTLTVGTTTTYTASAIPQRGPVAGDATFTLDNTGLKNGTLNGAVDNPWPQ